MKVEEMEAEKRETLGKWRLKREKGWGNGGRKERKVGKWRLKSKEDWGNEI
jgi:hypothetical protein